MDGRRAWEAVVNQLQHEMDRSTFDTWVRDAAFLSDGNRAMTVGVKNPATRDWLESRLTTTVSRLLVGLLDRETDIHFVVSPDLHQQDSRSEPDQSSSFSEQEIKEGLISIERSLLGQMLKPDSALYFPGYWLRWIPYVGAKAFATILAFRQALYLAENCYKENLYFPVSTETVGNLIGVTRQTIARQRDGYRTAKGRYTPPQLDWFLTVKKTNKVNYSSEDHRFAKEAHQYAFKTAPITPGDMDDLIDWLLENGLSEHPVKALELAVKAQPKEILSFPMRKPTRAQLHTKPSSAKADLLANILSYCPARMSTEDRQTVLILADKLRERIMESDGQVKVPLYFMRYVMPHIGITPAILIIYLRKRAYRNTATGEIRERVVLSGGTSELARALGVSPSGIYRYIAKQACADEWLNERRHKLSEYLSPITKRLDGKSEISVATADSLIPAHRQEYLQATALASTLIEHGDPASIEAVFEYLENSQNQTILDSQNQTFADSQNQTIGDSQNSTIQASQNQTFTDSRNRTPPLLEDFTKSNDIKYLCFNYLDLQFLKETILSLMTNLNSLTTGESGLDSNRILWKAVGKGWQWEALFKACRIDRATQQKILANQATPQAFVSHLIYAHSPEGKSLSHPVRYAISQILREGDGDLGHHVRHDKVASLGPAGMQALIRGSGDSGMNAFQMNQNVPGARNWEKIMGGYQNTDRVLDLGELLGLLEIEG
ncbi:MAG: hypothetical protein JW757_09900 [Anaerolineales bacterium]|nr:hypothetical protein [Anaerolineales bacterium]